MKTLIYDDFDQLSKAAADLITDLVQSKPDSLLCLPSGDSPSKIISYLVEYAGRGKVDFSRCTFVGLDEWVGMDGNHEGSCKHYLYKHLFTPLKIKPENIMVFDGLAADLGKECKRIDQYILKNGGIDIMMVGIGLNGHIGLNEPGTSPDLYSHHTKLDPLTKTVAQKYFNQETILTEGITLGLKHFMEAKTAILIANGGKKAAIVSKAINGEVTGQIPASIIQKHPNSYVFLDGEAASELS